MNGLDLDLYEARMAASYLRRGMTGPATFSLYARALPDRRGFLVAAGLADALAFLQGFRMDDDEVAYLRDVAELDPAGADLLRGVRFTGDVWAVPEGRVVLAGEPLLEVTAPAAEAQLVETALLSVVTFQTSVAAKAARCRLAAGGAQLIDFTMRRAPGLAAADGVTRATAIGGFDATSNVAAARRYGLRPAGTMAHSFVQAFPDEQSAFRAFALDHPQAPTLLVDTYDTIGGLYAAMAVIRQTCPDRPAAVRLDSGDLAALSARARRILDAGGLSRVRIVVSGGLDEDRIAALVRADAPIDAYGVGTRLGVSWDAPSLDSVYKLVAFDSRPVAKQSPGKATLPGAKQVFRDGTCAATDVLGLRAEAAPDGRTPLLVPVMRNGVPTLTGDEASQVQRARERCAADVRSLPAEALRLDDPVAPEAVLSPALRAVRDDVRAAFRRGGDGAPWR
ncbi:nicotinate phosphoribosyltransferase [Actinoplanes sp. NPDC049316]|uniref:nicotinate phosphoribosyltransferase n=1 Tax=Actinoplanes sp. NPDC049316 TaxID=3154727 RepID=UPI00341703C5